MNFAGHRAKDIRDDIRSRQAKRPDHILVGAFGGDISLTMSYFHTGIRTIIGAEVFHGPVR
ncbi:hypothetical protein, partial [Azohydromonas caseinilytica]|uniref:hypothetical protein n=1 Tax=Azohydromonas caseinilytica TaxID=2728836 RepID=UPI00197C1173